MRISTFKIKWKQCKSTRLNSCKIKPKRMQTKRNNSTPKLKRQRQMDRKGIKLRKINSNIWKMIQQRVSSKLLASLGTRRMDKRSHWVRSRQTKRRRQRRRSTCSSSSLRPKRPLIRASRRSNKRKSKPTNKRRKSSNSSSSNSPFMTDKLVSSNINWHRSNQLRLLKARRIKSKCSKRCKS